MNTVKTQPRDKSEAKRKKPNIIDYLIIIAVVAGIVGVALRFNIADKIGVGAAGDEVEVSFLIESVKPTSADAMKVGDVFYLDGIEIGTLKSRDAYAAETYIENDAAELVLTYDETKQDIRGVFIAKGTQSESGFMLGGTKYIGPGLKTEVKSKNISVTMLITDVTKIN